MAGDLLLSYYGDDFTGSTDVMEALTSNGVETVLFTRKPDEALLARFAGCRAMGLAGTSRSRSPDWMDAELPQVFTWLKSLGARFCHYKVCSTFDSAPHRGSIGRAMEIGLAAFGQHRLSLVVGAPQLRRYTFAGHLFAAWRDTLHRIDRHPVMATHPATPMGEADLLLHLAAQTSLPSALVGPTDPALGQALPDEARIVLIDVFDKASQAAAGTSLEDAGRQNGPLLFGSSGIEYALLEAWRQSEAGVRPVRFEPLMPQERMAVVSGSCSPTTERQIRTALGAGFTGIEIDYAALASGEGREAAFETVLARAEGVLSAGGSPLVYTALGQSSVVASGQDQGGDDAVGEALGRLLAALLARHGLARVAVAGGDTSSHALGALDIHALTLRHPISDSPGSPVCNAHGADGEPGVELILKGGQIGKDDYFVRLRDGTLTV